MRRLFEMKYIIAVASLSSCLLGSCGLMDTTSEEHLSGDEMWDEASVQTVEGFVNSIYTEFRTATMQSLVTSFTLGTCVVLRWRRMGRLIMLKIWCLMI